MRRIPDFGAAALGAAWWLAASGCYSYAALPPEGARAGEHVRIRVSGAEAERLEPLLGAGDRRIEGELLEQGDSGIALGVALPSPTQPDALSRRPQQRIEIPKTELQEMQLLRLDKLRTSLLIGGVAAIAVAIAASKGSSLLGSGNSGGGANEDRIPVFVPLRVRFALP
ncbi:MAG: hypothetical protein ACJ796_07975 [Gemmatimonadaceae bacterium]